MLLLARTQEIVYRENTIKLTKNKANILKNELNSKHNG